MFLWTDLETTGLSPHYDLPLSVGIIVTDAEFRERARGEWVIGWHPDVHALATMRAEVRAMHTANGLLERVQAAWDARPAPELDDFGPSLTTIGHVAASIVGFLDKHVGRNADIKARPPWAGNTVHFDKAFVEHHMPSVAEFYNYRCLDVSTLKVIAQAIAPGAREWCKTKEGQAVHTPLKDLEASLHEFAHWRRTLFNSAIGCCPAFAITHKGPPIIGNTPATYEPCTLTPGHMPPCQP